MQSNSSDNCIHHYNVEILTLFDSELQLINTKPLIKNKSKELLNPCIKALSKKKKIIIKNYTSEDWIVSILLILFLLSK